MKILLIMLTFFVQPIVWLGLLRSGLIIRSRLKRTRQQFNTAVYEEFYELRHFWLGTLFLGILLSAVSWLVEISLPLNWIVWYELLTGINLLLVPWFFLPVTIAMISTFGIMMTDSILKPNYLIVMSLIIMTLGLWIEVNGGRFNVPRIFRNRRSNQVAGYPFNELSIVPMLVMIPGNLIRHYLAFYPTFQINGHLVSFMLLPIFLGLRLTVFKHLPRLIFKRLGNRLAFLGIAGAVLAIVSFRWPILVPVSLVGLLLLTWLVIFSAKRTDLKDGKWCSKAVNGVRVVGIEPHTPADRMNLRVGDLIMNVNHYPVASENEFYKALQSRATYCKLRVMNTNNRIILTETAIFNDSPHDVGVVLFRDRNKQ